MKELVLPWPAKELSPNARVHWSKRSRAAKLQRADARIAAIAAGWADMDIPDGRLHLIDYKTGTPPSKKQQAAFDLQLHLAAAMAERGGFGDPAEVGLISYIGLSGDKAIDTPLNTAEIDEIWARFVKLIRAYQGENQGYTARRAVFEARFPGDYDHLSRFGEWDMTDKAQTTRLSDDPS